MFFLKFYWDHAIPGNCGYIPINLLVMLVSLKKVSTFKWIQIYFFGVLAHSVLCYSFLHTTEKLDSSDDTTKNEYMFGV